MVFLLFFRIIEYTHISQMLCQLPVSVLQPPLQPPEVALQLSPVAPPTKWTGGAWTDAA